MNLTLSSQSFGIFSAGWIDLSTHYNTSSPALVFVNSSFGTSAEFGSAGVGGPSIYPIPTFGFTHTLKFNNNYYVRSALMSPVLSTDTNSSDILDDIYLSQSNHLYVLELGVEEEKSFEYAVGFWKLKTESSALESFSHKGLYIQIDKRLSRSLHPFIRWGWASKFFDRVYSNLALGMELRFNKLQSETLSFGFSSARIESALYSEKVYEIIYSSKISKDLILAFSAQYILDPGGEEGRALAGTTRLVLARDWL